MSWSGLEFVSTGFSALLFSISVGEFLTSVMSFFVFDCDARFLTVTEGNLSVVFSALCCCVFI